MEKRNVLIVGGSGGIGKYMVSAFGEAGYEVIFTFCSGGTSAQQIAAECNATSFGMNATKEEDVIAVKRYIEEKYGRLDVLVYAAGVFEDSLVVNTTLESWERVISTNLTGAFLCVKHMTELLRVGGTGRFVCIGSVMGDLGTYGSCSYAAAKAALGGLVKSVALENAKYGVTANIVSHGYIDAGMTRDVPDNILELAMKKIPMKKLGNPEHAAKIVVDICSEHADYISGQTIRNNGLLYV